MVDFFQQDLALAPGSRIVVAMSGGVDSSVVAALLKEAGYDVIGITLQLYDQGAATGKKGACCAGQDIHDARNVADAIGIPHYVLDFEERFKSAVIDDFADTYAQGRTPIPCVRCNQSVKFRDLLQVAQDLGAEALATGHYARRKGGAHDARLYRGVDQTKDQSYFLFATTQAQLDYARFPLGGLDKDQTRYHAERLDLPVAQKPESQDICFVPSGHYSKLVRKLRGSEANAGDIVHSDGSHLGRHRGVINYTVGQRRGLGVANGERLYVIDIDRQSHRVTVGPREAGMSEDVHFNDINWLAGDFVPKTDTPLMVKHRYNEPAAAGRLMAYDGKIGLVRFEAAESGVAPGQACVLYLGDQLLGGGWIERAPVLQSQPRKLAHA